MTDAEILITGADAARSYQAMAEQKAADTLVIAREQLQSFLSAATRVQRTLKAKPRANSAYALNSDAQHLLELAQRAAQATREAEEDQVVAQRGPTALH